MKMSSEEQIAANRRNGEASNGPVSTEGKAISAQNSLKHELTSREVLMPNEDGEAFAAFCERLRAELNPGGELESVLAERIIGLPWRLRRLGKIEAGILTWRYYEIQAKRAGEKVSKQIGKSDIKRQSESIDKREILDRDQHERALTEQQEHRSAQESALQPAARRSSATQKRMRSPSCHAMKPRWRAVYLGPCMSSSRSGGT
jgi:hypothetical protein